MSASIMNDAGLALCLEVADAFLQSLDQIHLAAIPAAGGSPHCCTFDRVEKALAWASEKNAAQCGIYWTVNAVKESALSRKPSKDDIEAARFAHVDIDPPKNGGSFDRDAALLALATGNRAPSFVIDSGNGLQAFWRLDERCENWGGIEAVNDSLRHEFGGGDACHNIDRLMRLPGFTNWPNKKKAAQGRTPALATMAVPDDGEVFSALELGAAFPARPAKPLDQPSISPTTPPGEIMLQTTDSLGLGQLDGLRSAIEHPPGRDRSGDGVAVARLMANAKFSDERILGILLNPANAVSAHFLEQRDSRRAALRAIAFVRKDDGSEAHRNPGEAPKSTNEKPVNLWAHYTAPELPSGLLPPVIEAFARRGGEVRGVDPAGIALTALGVCAGAIPDSIVLQVKPHDPAWKENARIWVGLIGPPSVKKSPVMSMCAEPLAEIDRQLVKRYVREHAAYVQLTPKERKGAEQPKHERRVIEDATIEAIQGVLSDSPRGVLSMQDELSGWFGTMDRYGSAKSSLADRAFWLRAYNGGAYSAIRVGRGVVQIPNCSISLVGGIQPDVIRKLMADAMDDGLIQRFIPVVMRPGEIDNDEPLGPVFANYSALIKRLAALHPSQRSGAGDLSGTGVAALTFDQDAQATRSEMRVEHHELIRSLEQISPKLSAHYGKHDGLFARLCVIWHCIESGGARPNPVIPGERARRVADFMRTYIRPSAVAFYAGLLGLSSDHDHVLELAAEIVTAGHIEVTARTVQRATRSLRGCDADQARRLCEKLGSFGWLEPLDPKAKSKSPRWAVNPRVHEMFAERGREEAERRFKARRAIQSALGTG